jgi:hypothetical protein
MGLDPELAIVSKKTGIGRSAHQFIGDEITKYKFFAGGLENQRKQTGASAIGAEVGRDGPAIEVRSLIESACRDNIIPYMAEAMRQTQLGLDKWKKGAFTLSSTPKFELDAESFKGKVPANVSEFGCNPDIDAYTLQPKSPELDSKDKRRWTGGHIHASRVGAANNIEQQAALAILFDYFISVPMVAILGEKFAAGEAERRDYYGQPGSFRYDDKLDKIEFRTLSGRLLLHPTILYWAMGMVKAIVLAVGGTSNYKEFVQANLLKKLDPSAVFNIVRFHDVATAEKLVNGDLFKLLPSYQENKQALANPMSGGGGGTSNPYFYEQATRVFMAGNAEGLMWDDDLKFNWGLYEDYIPQHHAYWGIQQSMVGLCDDDIFPFNAVLPKVWPKELIQKKPSYRHPLNGGAAPMHGSPGWLR